MFGRGLHAHLLAKAARNPLQHAAPRTSLRQGDALMNVPKS
eukprot:CAMPEP_0180107546 /NCGR_PEP_ID=MMETSP0985-20121206/33343_1 /TAXON_ID=483367 /ORGANISM="non described non described, Strain CCMP 2436" /LENGTH=40 /DNA_ID= /DNA_START= /DNA_END= /DNA_ORIENTATION=